jgi:hypothetical protein
MTKTDMDKKDTDRDKIRKLLYKAMPYYDMDYAGDWNMDTLVDKVLEIVDGKK